MFDWTNLDLIKWKSDFPNINSKMYSTWLVTPATESGYAYTVSLEKQTLIERYAIPSLTEQYFEKSRKIRYFESRNKEQINQIGNFFEILLAKRKPSKL